MWKCGLNSTGNPLVDRPITPLSSVVFILWGIPSLVMRPREDVIESFVISLFMGDLLVFSDASFEVNEPTAFELNEPMWHLVFTRWVAVDFGMKDSSVVEEQRDFQLRSTNGTEPHGQFHSCIYWSVSCSGFTVQEEITVKLYSQVCAVYVSPPNPLY